MNHATYYPGAEPMSLKLLFDPDDGTILGAQAVGGDGVDKRIDVLATAMAAGIARRALADLELAYAPPFSSAKDPVNMLGYMAENILSGECDVVEPDEVDDVVADGLDTPRRPHASEHAEGSHPSAASTCRSTRSARTFQALATALSWSFARSASGATRRHRCSTNSA